MISEKLFEELITEGEGIVPTSHEKIMVLAGTTCNLAFLNGEIDELVLLAREQNAEKIREKLKEIISEYTPPGKEKEGRSSEALSRKLPGDIDDSLHGSGPSEHDVNQRRINS